jgi:uncharacterized coiled-coil DUF342 family protein
MDTDQKSRRAEIVELIARVAEQDKEVRKQQAEIDELEKIIDELRNSPHKPNPPHLRLTG